MITARSLRDWRSRLFTAEGVGLLLAAAAVLIAFGVALRGIGGPVPNGHFASAAAIGMCAENMWHWRTLLPIIGYHDQLQTNYYMHHPLGVFWDVAILGKLFGFHDWVVRLPPLAFVTATPWFLYRIGRELWGPVEGGLSALAYVALPITLGYANYHDLEQPYILGAVVASWAYVRYLRTWRERYAAITALALFFALNHAWLGYIWAVFFLGWLFVRGFVVPERLFGNLRARAFGRFWAILALAAVAAFGLELVLLGSSGRIGDVLSSYGVRRGGSSTPLALVLEARKYRIELMFTGLAIFLGKLGLPVIVARAALRRRDLELLPLPLFFAALVHYLVFKQGADVHIFWPHPFSPYFALAIGALAASCREALAWLAPRVGGPAFGRWLTRYGALVAGLLVGLPVLFVLRDGLSIVRLARESGGRFAEANLDSEVDKAVALRWFLGRVPSTAPIAFHSSVPSFWELQWEARPRPIAADQPIGLQTPGTPGVYVLDSRGPSLADLRAIAGRLAVHAVGPFWFIDRAKPAAPLEGYRLDEHEPGFFERWWLGDVEPVRAVRPDSWVTWEWRSVLGQTATAPSGTPPTTDDLRIAHNAALAAGDTKKAAALRAALVARFDLPLSARYANGTELVGGIHGRGAQRDVTLFFVAGRFERDAKFAVHARVVAPPRLSTLPVDPADLDLAHNPVVPTSAWRAGQIHAVRVVYRKRPGQERLTGAWSGGPARVGGPDPIEILQVR